MVHRGQKVREVLDELGVKVSVLADRIGYSRGYVYRFLEDANLSYNIIYKIGNEIRYDFRQLFPKMPFYALENNKDFYQWKEPEIVYQKMSVPELERELEVWKQKYYDLLEEYTLLLKKNAGA